MTQIKFSILILTFVCFCNLPNSKAELYEFKIPHLVYDSETGELSTYEFSISDRQIIPNVFLPTGLTKNDIILRQEGDRLLVYSRYQFYYFTKTSETLWDYVLTSNNDHARINKQRTDKISFFVMEDFGIYIFMSRVSSLNAEGNAFVIRSQFYSDQEQEQIKDLILRWLNSGKGSIDFQTYFRNKLPALHNKTSKLIAQQQAQKGPVKNLPAVVPQNANGKDKPLVQARGEDGQVTDAWTVINSFSIDLLEKSLNFVYTDLPELRIIEDQILRSFIQYELGSVKLLAPAGVGKTYLMQRLAYRFRTGDVPNVLKDYKIRGFSGASIDAGTKYVGTLEARAQALVDLSRVEKIIWFVDEAHTLSGVGTSASRKSNLMQILKPGLAEGYVKMLMVSTPQEWNSNFADDSALNRRLAEVRIPTPNPEVLSKIITGWVSARNLEPLSDEMIKLVIFYSDEFGIEGTQPSKATKLLNSVYSYYQFENSTGSVTHELLKKSVQSLYGVDPAELDFNRRKLRYQKIVNELDNLVGQEEAKAAILERARQIMSGVYDRSKPRYRLLFAGPKGQGKTEILRLLAKAYDQNEPHRVVMSDLTSPYMVDELKTRIGNILQTNPMAIIFFDELEKAHPAIQRVLISILDSGEVTYTSRHGGDVKVITLALKNSSIFASTNAGADYITRISNGKGSIGFGNQTQKMSSLDLRKQLVLDGIDEFVLDRMDGIVAFDYATKEEFAAIIRKQITSVIKKLKEINQINIVITDIQTLAEQLAELHYTPEPSIRDIERLIESNIRRPIANLVFDLESNENTIELKFENREIIALTIDTPLNQCEIYLANP